MSDSDTADDHFVCRLSERFYFRISGIFLYLIIKKLILMASLSHKTNFLTPQIVHYAVNFYKKFGFIEIEKKITTRGGQKLPIAHPNLFFALP